MPLNNSSQTRDLHITIPTKIKKKKKKELVEWNMLIRFHNIKILTSREDVFAYNFKEWKLL